MPVVLALLASAMWGTADFLGGTATRRLPVAAVLAASQLVALVALVPLALALGALSQDRAYVLPGVLAGLAGTAALAAFYRALAAGTMGVVAPIASLGVVVPVVAGVVSGERLSAPQVLGIGLAVLGVVLASGPELSGGRRSSLPLLLAALAAVGFGLVLVLLAEGSRDDTVDSVVMVLLTMRLTSVVVLGAVLLALARRGRRSTALRRADLPVLVAIGLLDVGANGAFAVASQSDLISVTGVLASLYPVVTVLLARRLHAERLARVQLAGVAVALVGVAVLAGG